MARPLLLSDAQVRELRLTWLTDLVDYRVEWGAAPLTVGSAAVAAAAISLDGLGAGTLVAGTVFSFVVGVQYEHAVIRDAAITSSAASVSISPALAVVVPDNTPVRPRALRRSIYNQRTGEQFFTDAQLQIFATRAWEKRGAWISTQQDSTADDALYRVIRTFACEDMLAPGSRFQAVVMAEDAAKGELIMKGVREQLREDLRYVDSTVSSWGLVPLVK